MADLLARFKLVDEMSDRLGAMADTGRSMTEQWERAGEAANAAFEGVAGAVTTAASTADGVATSIENIQAAADGAASSADNLTNSLGGYGGAVGDAAAQTDYWTDAVGNYDRSALEAIYTTEELVDMGLKSAEALEEQQRMMELCERSSSSLSQAIDATADIQRDLSTAIEKADTAISELSDNENVSAETKAELASAAERAQEAMNELTRAQEEADAAMEEYNRTMNSGTNDLGQLEAAAERAAHAAETLAEANGTASEATEELSRATEQASEEAENSEQSGIGAIEGVAGALAAAGITAKVKEIAEAVYELAENFSEAEKIIVASTGATGQELEKLTSSALDIFASSSAESLNDVAAGMTAVQTATGLTGEALESATKSALVLNNALGYEVAESSRTASALMKNFGLTAEEAYNLIIIGAQNGADKNGDLMDVLNEYSAQYAALGLSAEEFMSSLVDGAEAGVFSVDKVGDAVKEFNIRAKDGSDTTAEAFELLGMNAETMSARFAAGGETARTAFFEVVNALDSMSDPMEKNTAAVGLFGTMYEDLEATILPVLAGIEGGSIEMYDALETTAEGAQSLSDKWQEAGNSIQAAFTTAVEPAVSGISGTLADATKGVGDFLREHPAVTKAITAAGVVLGAMVVAIAGVSVASLTAIPAVAALGTAISAAIWPITLIAVAVAAVTAAVLFLVDAFQEDMGATEGMTAATRAQYYELENLNAEYDEAVAKYGENSEEALRLKYQIDDLSASFEANRQTVEEFQAEVTALCESVTELSDEFESSISEIDANEMGTLALIQKYEDLATQSELTGAQQKELEAITKKLTDSYPDLAAALDDSTTSAEDYVAAMKAAAEAKAEELRQQQAQDTYVEALAKRAELLEEIEKAQENVNLEQARMDEMSGWDHFWTGGEWDDLEASQQALDDLNAAMAENDAVIAEIEQGWEDIAEAEEAASGEAMSWQDAVSTAYEGVRSRIEELCVAYDEAYQAALDSFTGQFGLFDEASTSSEEYLNATVANAQAAMESQLAYWDTYLSNVETLKATSAEDLGITQENYEALMAYAQSGSEEAAGLAQSMVDAINSGNEEAVAELANTVGEVQARQQEASAAVADWQTSFSESLSSLEQEMQTAVEGMDLSAEAQASAEATISAYIEQIRTSGGEASAAAESVAQQIETALATQIDPEVDVDVNFEANTESIEAIEIPDKTAEATYELNSADVDNYVMQDQTAEAEYLLDSAEVDAYLPEDKSAYAVYDVNSYAVDSWNPPDKTATLTYNIQTSGSVAGHANGTTNAESVFLAGEEGPELVARRAAKYATGTTDSTDFFIAGENGPELIVGEQGSTVFPTEETDRLIAALNTERQPLQVFGGMGGGSSDGRETTSEHVKRILLEIAGSGAIEVGGSGGADKDTILEILYEHLKPVLMSIIQNEIYEEGELSYEY